jgi:hypothetical protein
MNLIKEAALFSIAMVAVSALVAVPMATAVEDKMNQVLQILEKVTRGSFDTLDRGWEIALKFKDPNYRYDPSQLGTPPASLSKAMENITITPSDLGEVNSTG